MGYSRTGQIPVSKCIFRAIIKMYYRNSNAVIIVFDITYRESFSRCSKIYNDLSTKVNIQNRF